MPNEPEQKLWLVFLFWIKSLQNGEGISTRYCNMVSSPKELRGAYILITIQFEFPNRRIGDLQQLNEILQTMELADLDLTDTEGYLATTKNRRGRILHQRYGLDRGTLHCELADGRPGHHYQINTYVADGTIDHDTYLDNWRQFHSDRVIRISIVSSFGDMRAYTIVHHEKAAESHE